VVVVVILVVGVVVFVRVEALVGMLG